MTTKPPSDSGPPYAIIGLLVLSFLVFGAIMLGECAGKNQTCGRTCTEVFDD